MALGPLQDQFKAHAEESAKLIAFQQQLLEAGLKSGSVDDSVIKTGAAATKDVVGSVAEKAEKQAKERYDDVMFLALMNDLHNALADAENDVKALEQELIEKYGENWDQIFYERAFGNDGADLSKEERLAELAAVYLDKNGNLLPEYADSPLGRLLVRQDDVKDIREAINSGDIAEGKRVLAEQGISASHEAILNEGSRELGAVGFDEILSRRDAARAENAQTLQTPFTLAVNNETQQEQPDLTEAAPQLMPFGNDFS